MAFDVLHLLRPAAVIPAKGFEAPIGGDVFKTRLCECQERSTSGLFQSEFDKSPRLS
jgi:hypothetical protein